MKTRSILFNVLLFLCNRIVTKIPSHYIRLFFYQRMMNFSIASSSYIFMDAWFDARGRFAMGPNSVINQRCRLDNRGGITIGANVSISPDVHIITADHDVQTAECIGRTRPVTIENYVFIGSRAMVLPGVTISEGAVVGAGAVVTRNVDSYNIVAGVPARPIGKRNDRLNYTVNYGRFLF